MIARSIVINIAESGAMTCLWTDAFPLSELGRLNIQRASSVDFNPTTQMWEVTLCGSERVDYSNQSRAVCIAWEVSTLNERLRHA